MMSNPTVFGSPLVDLDATTLESLLSSSSSPLTSTYSGTSGSSSSGSPTPVIVSAPKAPRKRVRIRPKVDLAPGQPATARGNPRVRVVVACYQCRARKSRCDGAKPICHNCQKRPLEAHQCSYDQGPNRRGRRKGSNHSPAQRSTESDTSNWTGSTQDGAALTPSDIEIINDVVASSSTGPPTIMGIDVSDDDIMFDFSEPVACEYDPLLYDAISATNVSTLQEPIIIVTPPQDRHDERNSIPARPSTQFSRDTWWDALLTFYATEHGSANGVQVVTPSHGQRAVAMKLVVSDLRAVFQSSPCWLGFIHLPRFFGTLFSPAHRHTMQPSVLLSALALGKLAQSSEAGNGARGRAEALKLLDMAHSALEGSLATGWIDIGLAQAALLLVVFEIQPHPLHSLERSNSALLLLDSIFRLFSLPNIDDSIKPRGRSPYTGFQPAASFGTQISLSTFAPLPAIAGLAPPSNVSVLDGRPLVASSDHYRSFSSRSCQCQATSLGEKWPSVHNLAPSWSVTMMWPEGLHEGDFRREECRRLVWSTVMVIANMHAYTSAVPDTIREHGRLFVREPENFSVLLPSEALEKVGVMVEPDDVWTIVLRTMFLLLVCMRAREDKRLSVHERAQFAVQVWLEIDDIEQRLERHTCHTDGAFGFHTKEMTFYLRMLTSYEFQRYIPQITTTGSTLFYRDKAESWLRSIERGANWMWENLNLKSPSVFLEHQNSLHIYWFISNIRRVIALWKADPGLIYGLQVAKQLAEHAEYLMMYWPTVRIRQVWQDVRYQLVDACLKAGIAPPSAALPTPLSRARENAQRPSPNSSAGN